MISKNHSTFVINQFYRFLAMSALSAAVSTTAVAESIPDLRDLTLSQAETALASTSINLVVERRDSLQRRGTIIEHFPTHGGVTGPDGKLLVWLSDGIMIPNDLINLPGTVAEERLTELGLEVQMLERDVFVGASLLTRGDVVEIIPESGSRIDATLEPINIITAIPHTATVPANLRSLDGIISMRTALEEIGLNSVLDDQSPPQVQYGNTDPCYQWTYNQHIAVSPPVGSVLDLGSTVTLTVTGSYIEEWVFSLECNSQMD